MGQQERFEPHQSLQILKKNAHFAAHQFAICLRFQRRPSPSIKTSYDLEAISLRHSARLHVPKGRRAVLPDFTGENGRLPSFKYLR